MNRYSLLALSVSAGLLSGFAWSDWCPGLVMLVAFVPFLLIGEHICRNPERYSAASYFSYLLPGFVIFSILTLGWIRVVSISAAIFVILTGSLLMTFTVWLAHIIRIKTGETPGFVSLIAFWLTLELICLKVNILSPWINLGNGLAKNIRFIQWYEITGVPGGTLWILASNLLLSKFITARLRPGGRGSGLMAGWLVVIIIPSVLSLARFRTIEPSVPQPEEVVVVQPDYDPFTRKFTVPFDEQLETALGMADRAASVKTRWFVLPETTVDDPVNENDLNRNKYITMVREFIARYPSSAMIIGMVTFNDKSPPGGVTASSYNETDPLHELREYYNSALMIDTGDAVGIYHKSKLVPGFERVYSSIPARLLRKFLPELGGTEWGFEPQKERSCFVRSDTNAAYVAPVICYESVFGQFVAAYVKKGARSIFVITNDGWWKNTNGYKHHFWYSSVRAIETRRPVIRSANTGISGIIDIRGKVISKSGWWVPAVIKGYITPETRITPYVRYGDYILRFGVGISILMLLTVFVYFPYKDKMQ